MNVVSQANYPMATSLSVGLEAIFVLLCRDHMQASYFIAMVDEVSFFMTEATKAAALWQLPLGALTLWQWPLRTTILSQ